MKPWIVSATAALLCVSRPASAQESRPVRPAALEAGVVMGIAQPYASLGVVTGPWSVRVSGTNVHACNGLQLNAGRVLRDEDNAKHTIGAVWGRFDNACWFSERSTLNTSGQYLGLAYDFQVKGFFIEFGPTIGSRNPVGAGLGFLSHIYGQTGFVYRFGKKYVNDDD